jgi:hypothetical protein
MHRNRLITGFLVLTLSIVSASTAWAVGAGETEILDKLIRVRTNQILAQPGNTLTPAQAMTQATNEITHERNQQHMGLGEIARSLGTTVGALGGASGAGGQSDAHAAGANAGGNGAGNGHGGGEGHGGGGGAGKK